MLDYGKVPLFVVMIPFYNLDIESLPIGLFPYSLWHLCDLWYSKLFCSLEAFWSWA